jgi:MFS family permease
MSNLDLSRSNLTRIYQMMTLNSVGSGFISIFIPIYLLGIGYSFQDTVMWSILHHVSLLLFCFAAVYISNHKGLVFALKSRAVLLPIYILLLQVIPSHPILFYVIPILIGLSEALYWTPLNILFIRNTEKDTMGGALSKFFSYPKFFTLLNPLIAAYIATHFGFPALFVVALFILVTSYLPVRRLSSEKTSYDFSLKKAKEEYHKRKAFIVPEIIDNFIEDSTVILTLFIFLSLKNLTEIGIIGVITSLSSIAFMLTIGKIADKWDRVKLMRIGSLALATSFIFVFLVGKYQPSPWWFYGVTVAMSFSLKLFLIPYQSLLINAGRPDDAQFVVMREFPVVAGRIILFVLAILLAEHLAYLFLICAALLTYFIFIDGKRLQPKN